MDFFAEYLGFLSTPAGWAALVTLVTMEVVLGIDNLIFISILTNKLPASQQARARRIGIGAALILRLAACFLSGRRPRKFTTRSIPMMARKISVARWLSSPWVPPSCRS